ncbi:MAG: NAD(P)H-dependent oxidoreductase [Rhodocyclaceae bacterium]|nr:NAD(P)H-dependent oxidoreductase [Rhodocyclaceae bacterium]
MSHNASVRVVILNGADATSSIVDGLCAEVERQLAVGPNTTRTFHLKDFSIGHCLGEFDCWVKTPGRCRIHDEGQEIERAVHDADLLVLVTPVRFGGYSAQLKKVIDRLIPLITPFFEKRADLTHHQHRYDRLPRFVGVGYDSAPTDSRACLFRGLVESNALNLGCPAWGVALVGENRASWPALVASALNSLAAPGNASGSFEGANAFLHQMIISSERQAFAARPSVAILIASARAPGTSTSEALANYFRQQLEREGATVQIVSATAFARDPTTAHRAATQLSEANILVVAAPLYVDSLPYLGVLALEQVNKIRSSDVTRQPARLVGVLNCGFPEPEQMRFALALLHEFAIEAGYTWAGALPVGGGESIHGRALDSLGGMTRQLRHALDTSAAALSAGSVIPQAASEEASSMFIPAPLYRLVGWWGWRSQARVNGLRVKDLRARPFDTIDDAEWERLAVSGSVRARPLRVVERMPEGADALTLVFDDPAGHSTHFDAGQYLTVELLINGERIRRAYSLSSIPSDKQLSITVKRVPGGVASNWIHDHLAVGALVRTFGPSGTFTAGPPPKIGTRHLLLIAGGSGIVPLAVIAAHVLGKEPGAEVTLIYGSASLERTIFAAALRHLAEHHSPRFMLQFVFETPPPGWTGKEGRMDATTLFECLTPIKLGAYQRAMLCGPDGMRSTVRQALESCGFPSENIVEESFTSPRRAEVPSTAQLATLNSAAQSQTFPVGRGQTLLEGALDAGIPLSFSCFSGGCGACRVRITSSMENVVLDEPNAVSSKDRARGEVPACLARLRGPVEFSVN